MRKKKAMPIAKPVLSAVLVVIAFVLLLASVFMDRDPIAGVAVALSILATVVFIYINRSRF